MDVTLAARQMLMLALNLSFVDDYSTLAKKFFDSHSPRDVLLKACLRPSRQCNR